MGNTQEDELSSLGRGQRTKGIIIYSRLKFYENINTVQLSTDGGGIDLLTDLLTHRTTNNGGDEGIIRGAGGGGVGDASQRRRRNTRDQERDGIRHFILNSYLKIGI